jgi:hypothetical protein
MEDLLKEFHQKLTLERIYETTQYESDITKCYEAILEGLITDYSSYRDHIPKILGSLEENNDKSIKYSFFIFDKLYYEMLKRANYTPFEQSIMEIEPSAKAYENLGLIFKTNLEENNEPRLSGKLFYTCGISDEEKKEIITLIIEKLQIDAVKITWTENIVESNLMLLYPLRALTSELEELYFFYFPTALFLDHLCLSEYNQQARNFAEELLICSFNDDLSELGFFTSFKIYSNQRNIQAAFLYGNLTLMSLLKKTHPYSEKIIQEVIWQSLKFMRNLGFHAFVQKYYNSIPISLNITPYEKRAIDQTYFSSLLHSTSPILPQTLLDYLHKERESILRGGIPDCTPWLIMLYNIKRFYLDADFSMSGLGYYLNIFEQVVPKENVIRYKNIIEGSVKELKEYLKESYIKLMETVSVSDVEYDNETALKIANRLIENSFKDCDFEAILLAMVVKSDYSLIHKNKETTELTPFILPDLDPKKIYALYSNKENLSVVLKILNSTEIIWFVETEGKLFQLSFCLGEFNFNQLSNWEGEKYHDLTHQDYFSSLEFETTKKDKFDNVYSISPEEYLDERNEIIGKISFSEIFTYESKALLVVKDMKISAFPHNLLINQKKQFIHLTKPITNILSTEWYLNNVNAPKIQKSYSKSIWIPTEEGDFTLNYLFGKIESCLNEHSFEIKQSLSVENPISSDVNIIGSHGDKDISQIKVIYPNNMNPLTNLNKVIGSGKVLIFFVCYSGSQSTDFFKNSVSSLVKEFIAQGYQSIIAPAWALHVDIPPLWLPVFLESLNSGDLISVAHHKANMAVYDKFPTPAAWACLHLFGNPNLTIT